MSKKLLVGFVLGGLVTGFMVGASSSPVVGAVIPAIVSAITAVVALIFKPPSEAKNAPPGAGAAEIPISTASHWRVIPKVLMDALGVALTLFFVAYIVGLATGSGVRTRAWGFFGPQEPLVLLSIVNDSKTFEEGLVRVQAFVTLKRLGVSDAVIIAAIKKPQPGPGAAVHPLAGTPTDSSKIPDTNDQWIKASDILKAFPTPAPGSEGILTYTPLTPLTPLAPGLPPADHMDHNG